MIGIINTDDRCPFRRRFVAACEALPEPDRARLTLAACLDPTAPEAHQRVGRAFTEMIWAVQFPLDIREIL